MHANQNARFLDPGPERVELGEARGARASKPPRRGGTDQDAAHPTVEAPLQFDNRLVNDGQGDDRCGEDPVLVVEGPLIVDPFVERVDYRVGQVRVVPHALLEEAGQGGEHERPVEAQLVQVRQAGFGGPGPFRAGDRFAEDLPEALAVRVSSPIEVLLGAGRGDNFERRIRDVLGDFSVDGDLGPAVDLHIGDGAAVLGREVPGEGLLGLIHVVVRVEDGKVDGPALHGGHLPAGVVITPRAGPPPGRQSPSATRLWPRHGDRCPEIGSTRRGPRPGPAAHPPCSRPGRTR